MKKTERAAIRTEQLGAYADRMAGWLRDFAATSDAPVLPVLALILGRVRDRFHHHRPSAYRIVWQESDLRGRLPAVSWSELVAASEALGGLWLDKKAGGRTSGSVFGCWHSFAVDGWPARLETCVLGPLDPAHWGHLIEADRLGSVGTEANHDLALAMHARLCAGLMRGQANGATVEP